MIVAIYARKSTEQTATEAQKSTARQIALGREYAGQKGWVVREECVWADDAISGGEFVKRPGFNALMEAVRSKPLFDMLIVSELSRLGRDQFYTLGDQGDCRDGSGDRPDHRRPPHYPRHVG